MSWYYNSASKLEIDSKDDYVKNSASLLEIDNSSKDDYVKDEFKPDNFIKPYCVDVYGGEVVECVNTPAPIEPLTTGAVIKVPAVLAELTVQFNVKTIITLPEPAIEIKNIKKRLKITQCLLLQDTNMLFIKGFVRKNIDYSTKKCSNKEGLCGDIRHCTLDAPFECATAITFNGLNPFPVIPSSSMEFEYFKRNGLEGPWFAEKDELLAGDLSEFNQTSTEFFNELPYCELINSRIVEFDEYLNRKPLCGKKFPFEEKEFHKIEEKMVIYLTLKILQNRQVAVPPLAASFCKQ